jgi:GntR family transcriptional regulator, transcriptional repressor for pyruvate dehydrogenase complex
MASTETESAPIKRARGLVQEVVQALADSIQQGALQPGDKLPTETEIMQRFDVSRSVVREAISRLQANQLVETRHGIGTFALAPPPASSFTMAQVDLEALSDVLAMLELRVSLETEAAGLAAQRRSSANLEAMQAHLQAFEACIHTGSDPVPADFAFHKEVARSAGNRHFADLMTYLGTMVIPRTMVDTTISVPAGHLSSIWTVHAEHENIFKAIHNQDSDSARAAMRLHLSNSRERLKQSHALLQPPR